MHNHNSGNQYGDGSINVGVGDFRGANVNVDSGVDRNYKAEEIEVTRHNVLGNGRVTTSDVGIFGYITGAASVVGLYFTLFQGFPSPKYASWSTLFLFSFAIAASSLMASVLLRRQKFVHFFFRRFYLEEGTSEGVYLSRFTATCPWCRSRMNLRNIGPSKGYRADFFLCERNPEQHRIHLDPTALPPQTE